MESNQQEALPNYILKECVRPALNILSTKTSTATEFSHLKRLIKVLHGCFNDQLGRHLNKTLDMMKKLITEDPNVGGGADDQSQSDQNRMTQELYSLVQNYNGKIENLEIASHIIEILHLLPPVKESLNTIFQVYIELQSFVNEKLEQQFKDHLLKVYAGYANDSRVMAMLEQNLRPLTITVGLLKSNLTNSLARYFNKNPFEAFCILYQQKDESKLQMFLEILKRRSSFCLRERVSREANWLGLVIEGDNVFNPHSVAIRLVHSFVKFNPKVLNTVALSPVVQCLVKYWVESKNEDRMLVAAQHSAQSKIKKNVKRVLYCLLEYCKGPHSEENVATILRLVEGY